MAKAKKGLKLFDIIAFTFSAVFVLDSFASAAAIGWQSIIYWIILSIFYFLPYGLITAELGAAYSDDGGIYTWVKKACGNRWAARTNWFYWLNVGLWMSSVYIAFSSSLSKIFFPTHPLSLWVQIGIAIAITWLTVLVGLLNFNYIKWLPNFSTISKLVVTVGLIAAAITWLATGNPIATKVNDPQYGIVPSWTQGIVFLPVIIYNLSGFELGSNTTSSMKNPKRDIPLSTILAGVTIVICYLIGTIAVNIVTDIKTLDISNGIIQTIGKVFPEWLTKILGVFLLFTFFGNMITSSTGANKAIQEAAGDGEFPKTFATVLKNNSPFWSTIITGIICTILLIIAGVMSPSGEISDIFWQLYAFSSIIFLLPYLLIFPSFLIIRYKYPNLKRPFKIPGPQWFQWIVVIIPMLILCLSIILFLFGKIIIHQQTWAWNDGGQFIAFALIGTMICIIIGELLIWWAHHQTKKINLMKGDNNYEQTTNINS
ncbi:APC family permease [Spiroplasma eriocheiris]|uniref:Amino acid permease n=1 Tax=Spiroplasma eriocheiris TaxID=315358 RepID=A0A0H3XNC8_9MOLU|nr:APC family permease [Spiroplasma eriocheiris]AHF58260.1 putative amino acid permease [Spiroplasma eriocheiris CCTCC M 207170]AKM54697.1 amino acid permease [Spiroplasma eriocheiris]